jgi:hypothetical protein
VTTRLLVVVLALTAFTACESARKKTPPRDEAADITPPPDPDTTAAPPALARIQEHAAALDRERPCPRPVTIYEGSIAVDATDYLHTVERGDDYVDAPLEGLDRVLSRSTGVRFVLDYPFERPFEGVVTGELTLRRAIDAIRAGFRTMYRGTTEREIPGLENRDVTGPHGQAFHVIGDLVIEQLELCADDTLRVFVGS